MLVDNEMQLASESRIRMDTTHTNNEQTKNETFSQSQWNNNKEKNALHNGRLALCTM